MKVPVKFVSPLDVKQTNKLNSIKKKSPDARVRLRAHAILLSSEDFSLDEIAKVCRIGRDTASLWIDKWEQFGFEGLK